MINDRSNMLQERNFNPDLIKGIKKKKDKQFDVKLVSRKLWSYFKQFRGRIALVIILSVLGAIMQGATVFFVGRMYDDWLMNQPEMEHWVQAFSTFCLFGALCIILYCFNNLMHYIINVIMMRLTTWHLCYNLRQDLNKKLQKLSIKYFDTHASGEIITRLDTDISILEWTITQYLVQDVYWSVLIVAVVVVMGLLNWALTLITVLIYPLLVLITVRLTKIIYPYYNVQQRETGRLNSFIEERVSGVKIVTLYQQQQLNEKEFKKINTTLTDNSVIANAFSNMLQPLNAFVNNISFVILAAVGIYLVMGGVIGTDWGIVPYTSQAALLIVFTILSRNLTQPTNQIMMSMGALVLLGVSAERVFEILDDKDEEEDPRNAIELKHIKGVVEAKGLYFGYNPHTLILRNINFKAEPNKVTALVGPTGAGKTTITSLITKFYDITSGDLTIDGISIKKIDRHSLRKNITCVLQDTFLFSKTIRENIKYGRPDATDEEVIAAAKASYAHNFIIKLPYGYDTVLSDNGQNLSQGQRQMLAIARAFLANAKIVILDEASSSIDTKTEIDLQRAFEALMKGRTTFMIAHRLSTMKNADNIIVINHGKIVEQGKHVQLLNAKGFYAKLYKSQFTKGEQI